MKTLNYLLTEARKQYGEDITPCGKKDWNGSITSEHDGKTYLWFNTPDQSTRVISCRNTSIKELTMQFYGLREAARNDIISHSTANALINEITNIWGY